MASRGVSALLRLAAPTKMMPRTLRLQKGVAGVTSPLRDEIDIDELSERYGRRFTGIELAVDGINRTYRVAEGEAVFCREAIEVLRSFQAGHPLAQMIGDGCLPVLTSPDQLALPRGICHGDAWRANARLSDDTIAFFDFDDCGIGPLMIDLGTQAWHLLHDNRADATARTACFVNGYDSVRRLTTEEREALPAFIALAEIRSLLFLAKYCALTTQMWDEIGRRASGTLSRNCRPLGVRG